MRRPLGRTWIHRRICVAGGCPAGAYGAVFGAPETCSSRREHPRPAECRREPSCDCHRSGYFPVDSFIGRQGRTARSFAGRDQIMTVINLLPEFEEAIEKVPERKPWIPPIRPNIASLSEHIQLIEDVDDGEALLARLNRLPIGAIAIDTEFRFTREAVELG